MKAKKREKQAGAPRARVEKKTLIALSLAVLAGILDFFGFVGFDIFPLAWIAWVPMLVAVRDESPKRAFGFGMVFGTIAHAGGYYWVAQMLQHQVERDHVER